jgi:hypothetical protein
MASAPRAERARHVRPEQPFHRRRLDRAAALARDEEQRPRRFERASAPVIAASSVVSMTTSCGKPSRTP